MHLSQVFSADGKLQVVVRNGQEAYVVDGASSVYALAMEAIEAGNSLAEQIGKYRLGRAVDLDVAYDEGRIAAPVFHADAAHTYITGTGLTHLGSAATRDAMHMANEAQENQTDTMKMFRLGLEGGKPEPGEIGVAPEWFYKGNGDTLVAPGRALVSPAFAKDAGEEPEIAGIYIIGPNGVPFRLGFALANEFSDHVIEKENYLYLAHSKLRQSSIGPEIFVGSFPQSIIGNSRIYRHGDVVWEKEFSSGSSNMSHDVSNLEHHHFKYELFRNPGDLHIHMFGTATLSFADGVKVEDGDEFEIEASAFGMPLRNRVKISPSPEKFEVKTL